MRRTQVLALAVVLLPITIFSCASLHSANHPTRAQTSDEYAIMSAFNQYLFFCSLGGGVMSDTPEEPEPQSQNFVEKLFRGFEKSVRGGFRKAMEDDVMVRQTRILETLPALFDIDPDAELGIEITPRTLEIAFPLGTSNRTPKDGQIDCVAVEPSESRDVLRAIREHWGTFAVRTYEDGTLEKPQATLRFDLTVFPTDDPDYESRPPNAPRYIQPTVLHLTKDLDWKIVGIQTRPGGSG